VSPEAVSPEGVSPEAVSPEGVSAADPGGAEATAREWLREVARAGFVPGTRQAALTRLRDLLRELLDAATAEPFDPARGVAVGRALVEHRMAAPGVAGATVRVLGVRLPQLLDGPADRVPELLGHVADGFTEAQRDAALTAAESLNRTEKLAWHQAQRDLQDRLQYALLHEAVTRLPNRAHLRAELTRRVAAAGPDGRIGLAVLRVDQFADLNAALGHDAGDRLLAGVAARVSAVATRSGYLPAHLGDDRFALLVPDPAGPDDVVKAVAQVAAALSPAFDLAGYAPALSVTAGLAEGPAARTDAAGWLRDAAVALGWAVADGTPFAAHEPARAAGELRRHRLTAEMPDALDAGRFRAWYQPLHRLADRSVAGYEALARWERPDGVLRPAEFIPLAERTGLIVPLGRRILEQACAQGQAWRAGGDDLVISVNLSPRQLADRGLVATIAGVLDRTGLPPAALQLEITENAVLDEHRETLRDLAGLGVRLAVDDFGTGWSSLALLPRLGIHAVKLAAEFLQSLDDRDMRAATVLRHTIAFCRDLGLTVTGEGVETEAQERRLRDLGCHLGQGFRFGRPAPPVHWGS
jgi:diguanylate cyclase